MAFNDTNYDRQLAQAIEQLQGIVNSVRVAEQAWGRILLTVDTRLTEVEIASGISGTPDNVERRDSNLDAMGDFQRELINLEQQLTILQFALQAWSKRPKILAAVMQELNAERGQFEFG